MKEERELGMRNSQDGDIFFQVEETTGYKTISKKCFLFEVMKKGCIKLGCGIGEEE